MPSLSVPDWEYLIEKMRQQLKDLHKRALTDLEEEERVRAEFEKRKTRSLKLIIEEEEKRVMDWKAQLKLDIERKERELKEWREK